MSVVRQDPDLETFVNEVEAKVLLLMEHNKTLERRVRVLEKAAKKHGVNVGSHEADKDACIIV